MGTRSIWKVKAACVCNTNLITTDKSRWLKKKMSLTQFSPIRFEAWREYLLFYALSVNPGQQIKLQSIRLIPLKLNELYV
jgi:hypothetical protein